MNFKELCLQVAKESRSEFNQNDVKKVLLLAIRVILEEFSVNPIDADLNISGFGRFYMNRNKFHVGNCIQGNDREYKYLWTFNFRAYRKLKELINGKLNPIDYQVSRFYLYPEYHMEDGVAKTYNGMTSSLQPNEIRHTNEYWLEKIKAIQEDKLRLQEDGTFVEIEKRGRPRLRLSAIQVRHLVMIELKRDLRRELRWEKQGKITKEDWTIARW